MAISYATSEAFSGVGYASSAVGGGWGVAIKIVDHAAIGCAPAEASGGSCRQGALANGLGAAATVVGNGNFVITVIAGGIGAELGGGKFANGALSASMGYLFNNCSTNPCDFWGKVTAFFDGAVSVINGVGNAARFVGRGTGVMGSEEQTRWRQEAEVVDSVLSEYFSDQTFRGEVNAAITDKAREAIQNNQGGYEKWFVTGRVVTGVVIAPILLGPMALIGDTTRSVEKGYDFFDSFLRGGIGGKP
jgi:hypothetical protein